jgi:POT family proton-dependent oligopeptide transporter
MGFAFLPIGIGSLIGGPLGGYLLKHYGEELHRPEMLWFVVTGIGLATSLALFIYDRFFLPRTEIAPAA